MTTVPSNLTPTRITQLPEYAGSSTAGYLPYVIDGITYKVQFSNIAAVGAVPSSRTITGGGGLTGGGDLTTDRVISIAAGGVGFGQLADSGVVAGTYGDSANIPVLTVDQKGRVTIASTTPINLAGYVPTSRSILAGTGLSGGGTLAADRTISLTLSSATPQPGGVPSAGSGTVAAREDHVHPAVDLSDTTETSGVLPMSRGGTGGSLSPVAGALVYSDGSKFDLTTLGSTGQALFGNGAGAPTWHTISTSLSGLTMGFVGANYTLSGTLGITSGGTGATTAAAALANLLPNYAGNAGKLLAVNGTASGVEWAVAGTVTSVDVSGGATGLTSAGGPVTGSGTITLGGTLNVASGGTGATTAATARANLLPSYDGNMGKALVVDGSGTNVQWANVATVTSVNASGGTTGLSFTGGPVTTSGTLTLSGTLAVGSGGTGSVNAAGARVNLLPSYAGNAGKVLAVNPGGTDTQWLAVGGTGTVSSVDVSGGTTGLTTSGGPITAAGTITLAGTLAVANGGTGAAAAAGARVNLLPSYTGNAGKTLVVNGGGTDVEWATATGGVTSVDASGGTTGLTFSGGPITTSGTLTLAGTLAVANGGTGKTTHTANAVLTGNGTSALGAVSPGSSGNVLTSNGTAWVSSAPSGGGGPSLQAVVAREVFDGSPAIINSAGEVEAVQRLGGSLTSISAVLFDSTTPTNIAATYDAAAQRVVIAYRDQGNSNFGTAIVGTVSGTTISFGTPVVFESASTDNISATYDASTQRIVITYRDVGNSNFGTAIVGTVSGTSISFGTAVVFESANTTSTAATYDANTQRVVVAYRDVDNSNFGTAIVGTVSGTSISFGTAAVFESASTDNIAATYDAVAMRVVIAYRDVGNSNFGTAIVGTVSGTSISFGTAAVFESANTTGISCTYDANARRVVVAYRDNGNSNYGTVVVGTVSGTSVSFGTPVVFRSRTVDFTSMAYDARAQLSAITFFDENDGYRYVSGVVSSATWQLLQSRVFNTIIAFTARHTATVYDAANQRVVSVVSEDFDNDGYAGVTVSPVTNLTAENYIGISNAVYVQGSTATIQIAGAVDDAQSGLTPGRAYYVQVDGTLSTTPGSPSVFAGTAVAATKIIVKG